MKTLIFLLIFALLQSSRSYSDILVGNMDPSEGITISSQIPAGLFGSPVRNAGDFNGDGFADIIIGSSAANDHAGIAYVIFGSANGLSNFDVTSGMTASQGIVISTGNMGDELGGSLGYAGDVNDDGIDDVIIGASGIVYVIYGSKTPPANIDLAAGLDQSQGFTVLERDPLEIFGGSVSYAGDVNNDKIDDVLIGAYGTGNAKGSCYVIFGKKGPRSQINLASGLSSNEGFAIIGPPVAKSYFGWSASNAGDIDGDGIGDIIIGAYGIGIVYIIYGQESPFGTIDLASGLSQPEGFSITGKSASGQFGYSVRSAGDFNGDGKNDVIIGAYYEDTFHPFPAVLLTAKKFSEFQQK